MTVIARNSPVNFYLVSRKEAEEKLSRLTTLAKGFSEEISEVRLVEIEGVTIEACGGTHLKEYRRNKGYQDRRSFKIKGKATGECILHLWIKLETEFAFLNSFFSILFSFSFIFSFSFFFFCCDPVSRRPYFIGRMHEIEMMIF